MDAYHRDRLAVMNQVYHHTLPPVSSTLPTVTKVPLFPHQVAMVQGMCAYREQMRQGMVIAKGHIIRGKVGIVADPAGQGKTFSVLAYLSARWQYPTPSDPLAPSHSIAPELSPHSTRYFFSESIPPTHGRGTNLIIVPHALFGEWKEEIERRVTLPYVAIETRRALRGPQLPTKMAEAAFVLTTNRCYKHVNEYAQQHAIFWKDVMIDEATTIYMNSSDPPLVFDFLWLITSEWLPLLFKNPTFHRASLFALAETTPVHPELYAWLVASHTTPYEIHLTSSGWLKDYLAFQHPERWRMVLRNPISALLAPPSSTTTTLACRPQLTLPSLASLASLSSLSPLAQPTISQLFSSLGVAFHTLDTYLPQHPAPKHPLIRRSLEDNECVICLERCEYPTLVDCCYHLYCGRCLLRSLLINGKCATCRDHVHPGRIACFAPPPPTIKSKMDTCLDLLRSQPDGRFLIYSAFDNIFYQLFEELDRMGRKAERIENHLLSLRRTVQHVKTGTTPVVFVSHPELLKGFSLTSITHLIFYHEPASYEKRQLLLEAVNRWGRSQPLHVIHLTSEVRW